MMQNVMGGLGKVQGAAKMFQGAGGGGSGEIQAGPVDIPQGEAGLQVSDGPRLTQIATEHMRQIRLQHAARTNHFSEYMSREMDEVFAATMTRQQG
jgi:hypothetical protein